MRFTQKNYDKFWDQSYKNLDNFLFYPNEEVVRFVSKYIYKRKTLKVKQKNKTFLDIGCGSGRNVKFLIENGFKCIGLDHSKIAIKYSKKFLKFNKLKKNRFKLISSNSTNIPLKKDSVDYIIADACVDSMSQAESLKTIKEAFRVLKKGGLFYVNLIDLSIFNKMHKGKFITKYDFKISSKHEKNTIQSFFNEKRINELFKNFRTIELYKIIKKKKNKIVNSRYHLILKKFDD